MNRTALFPGVPTVTLAPLLVAACAGGDAQPDELSLDDLPVVEATEELRIGSVNDPDYGFSRIGSMDVGPEGRIYVTEGLDRQIRVYSPDGRLLHTIGRPGDGPGEFQGTPGIGVRGDTVWAVEGFGVSRVTLFDREGTLLQTRSIESILIPLWGGSYGHVRVRAMGDDGLLWSTLNGVSFSSDNPAPDVGDSEPVPVPRVLFHPDGDRADTVGWDPGPPPVMARPPSEERQRSLPPMVEHGSLRFSVPSPPSETPRWIHFRDGRLVVESPVPTDEAGQIIVTRIDLAQDTMYRRVFHYTADPYGPVDLDAIAAEALDRPINRTVTAGGFRGSIGGGSSNLTEAERATLIPRVREAMDFPRYRQGALYGTLDDDGRLWLNRELPEGSPSTWVVLDPDGLPLGEVTTGTQSRFGWSSGDTLYVSEEDELGVPWLVRYRVAL